MRRAAGVTARSQTGINKQDSKAELLPKPKDQQSRDIARAVQRVAGVGQQLAQAALPTAPVGAPAITPGCRAPVTHHPVECEKKI